MSHKIFHLVSVLCVYFGSNAVLSFPSTASQRTRYSVTTPTKGLPIILVPGDGGSQFEAKLNKSSVVHYICDKHTDDFFDLWLNMELLVPVVIDCWVDNMRLIYDRKTRKTCNAPGVEIRIPGFGNTSTVEWLDPSEASPGAYFKDIGNALVSLGYDRGVSLRGAPYDFRKAPNEHTAYFSSVKLMVEEMYVKNGQKKVILLCHSMGCPMMLYFLNHQMQSWKDKFIQSLITLAGPWGGTVKALKVYSVGDNLGVYVLTVNLKSLRTLQRTSPSLAWLMPSDRFWNTSEVLIQTPSRNYTLKDYYNFFRDIEYPLGWEMRQDTHQLIYDLKPPGVEVHCLHGGGVDTTERVMFDKGQFPDGSFKLVTGDGDGTVNMRSLLGCLWWQTQQKQKVYHQVFNKVDHMGILHDSAVIDYIKQVASLP